MDKDILYKYFDCKASEEEERMVVDWVNASPGNQKQFEEERKLWALLCLREDLAIQPTKKLLRTGSVTRWLYPAMKVACILVLGLFIGKILFSDTENGSLELQTVIAPVGQQTEIRLADGSKIWLNSNSSVTYPTSFDEKERCISLEGEAYFEVAKQHGKPFIVRAGKYNVQVLGTTFNVVSRPADSLFETSLYTGSVKVYTENETDSSLLLEPHEKVRLEKDCLVKSALSDITTPAWKLGLFDFDNAPFREVIAELETYYSVTIRVENDNLYDYKYTGKLRHRDGLESIFQVLSKDNPFRFSKDENGYYHLK